MNVFWFRRDLRVDDNKGFFEALNSNSEVLPLFIFDKNIIDELPKDDARVSFIHERLDIIDRELKKFGKNLAIFQGDPIAIIQQLISENQIEGVYTNHDYEPYAKNRDQKISSILATKNIEFHTFKDQVIFEKSEVVKDDQTPYVVFTPYSRKWKAKLTENPIKSFFANFRTHIRSDLYATERNFIRNQTEFHTS